MGSIVRFVVVCLYLHSPLTPLCEHLATGRGAGHLLYNLSELLSASHLGLDAAPTPRIKLRASTASISQVDIESDSPAVPLQRGASEDEFEIVDM